MYSIPRLNEDTNHQVGGKPEKFTPISKCNQLSTARLCSKYLILKFRRCRRKRTGPIGELYLGRDHSEEVKRRSLDVDNLKGTALCIKRKTGKGHWTSDCHVSDQDLLDCPVVQHQYVVLPPKEFLHLVKQFKISLKTMS